jgi:uncharacterized protein
MTSANPLRIPVADLLRRPGAAREFAVTTSPTAAGGALEGLDNGVASVPADARVRIEGTLEHVADGIVVRGSIDAPWQAPCRRCLVTVTGEVQIHVDELFERAPLAGETYPLDEDSLDLTPLVRDTVLLELPTAPLCSDDCAGICPVCGADRNQSPCECRTDDADPRWAALRALEL